MRQAGELRSVTPQALVLIVFFVVAAPLPCDARSSAYTAPVSLFPTQDSEIWQLQPEVNFGSTDELWIASQLEGGQPSNWRSILMFDVSGIGDTVTSAQLVVHVASVKGTPQGRIYDAIALSKAWTESSVTWNMVYQHFTSGSFSQTTIGAVSSGSSITFEVTDIVQKWISGTLPNFGIGIWDDQENSSVAVGVRFYSREDPNHALRPTLTISTETTPVYRVLQGRFVDVDWSKYDDHPEVAVWAQRTADAEYLYLAAVQGVPSQYMRRSLIHLKPGTGGSAYGEVDIGVDWFFGQNLEPSPDLGPSAGMSPSDYSLQRLDAELYHEIAHNMAVVSQQGYRPSWFTEALGTWAQSSVTQPGAYTGIAAQMEDALWTGGAYSDPDAFAGYGKGALFLWWLVEQYGITGLHQMVSQCYGWGQPWSSEQDIDARGFLPWTGRTRNELSQAFESTVRSGWRIDIRSAVNSILLASTTSTTTAQTTTVVSTHETGTTTSQTSTAVWTAASTLATTTTVSIGGVLMQLISSSFVSAVTYDPARGVLSFLVAGPSGTPGFLNVTIGKNLLYGTPILLIDGVEHPAIVTRDIDCWHIYATYSHSQHRVTIGGSSTIPEFPPIPLLLAVFTLVIAILRRRLGQTRSL